MKYLTFIALVLFAACTTRSEYDLILRNGTIYDGSGSTPFVGDIGINRDTIAAIGNLKSASGKIEVKNTWSSYKITLSGIKKPIY